MAEIRIEGLRETVRNLRSVNRNPLGEGPPGARNYRRGRPPGNRLPGPRGETKHLASSFIPRATQRARRVDSPHPSAWALNFAGTIRHVDHRHSRAHLIRVKAREYGSRGLKAGAAGRPLRATPSRSPGS